MERKPTTSSCRSLSKLRARTLSTPFSTTGAMRMASRYWRITFLRRRRLNEIVVSEEKPTLAVTRMDLMMPVRFAVRERTEVN